MGLLKYLKKSKMENGKIAEVKTEEVKTDGVKTEEVKTDGVKTEEVKAEKVKTEEVKAEKVKTDGVDWRREKNNRMIKSLQQEKYYICSTSYETYIEVLGVSNLEKMEEVFLSWYENQEYLYSKDRVENYNWNHANIEEIPSFIKKAKKQLIILEKEIKELRKQELLLRDGILDFTKIVTEIGNKYKLSPTWEGNKPVLIERQKQLEQAKSEYETKEAVMDQKILAYNQQYQTILEEAKNVLSTYINDESEK